MNTSGLSVAARGWLIIFVGGVAWGVTIALAKIVTADGAHPLGIALWQGILGGATVLAYTFARKIMPPLDRAHIEFYIVCGLFGTALPGSLFFYAADHLPAGVMAIVIAIIPMMSFAIAAALGIDRISAFRLLGVALGLAAIVMMIAPETSLPEPGLVPWLLLVVAASLSYAIENNYIAIRIPPETHPITLLCGMFVAAGIMMAPIVAATGTFVPFTSLLGTVELGIIAMTAINVFCYGMFIHLISLTGPVFASQMAYAVTISGVIWGIVIFGEEHSPWIWGALIVMLAGLALVKPVNDQEAVAKA